MPGKSIYRLFFALRLLAARHPYRVKNEKIIGLVD